MRVTFTESSPRRATEDQVDSLFSHARAEAQDGASVQEVNEGPMLCPQAVLNLAETGNRQPAGSKLRVGVQRTGYRRFDHQIQRASDIHYLFVEACTAGR